MQSEKDKEGLDRLDKLNVARLLAGFGGLEWLDFLFCPPLRLTIGNESYKQGTSTRAEHKLPAFVSSERGRA